MTIVGNNVYLQVGWEGHLFWVYYTLQNGKLMMYACLSRLLFASSAAKKVCTYVMGTDNEGRAGRQDKLLRI